MFNFEPDQNLYRGIHPDWWSHNDKRPSSLAFDHYKMSVDWCIYSTPSVSFDRYKRLVGLSRAALASIKVRDALLLQQEVKYNPCEIRGEYNPAHTLVIGSKPKKTVARRFAREFARVIFPLES